MSKMSLADARISAKLSLEAMASKLKVTLPTYTAWENGNTEMGTRYFLEFCRITGVSVDDICFNNKLTNNKLV